jgi:PPOX class probable F420-dependent enzyme
VTLSPAEHDLLADARRATLATIDPDGRPRLVPVCFVVIEDVLWTPLDEKPKTVADPHALARVRDIEERPEVALLVDRWSEDWTDLAWLRLEGRAVLVEPPPPPALLEALLARYPQYASHDLRARPAIRIQIERVITWMASADTR